MRYVTKQTEKVSGIVELSSWTWQSWKQTTKRTVNTVVYQNKLYYIAEQMKDIENTDGVQFSLRPHEEGEI